MSDNLKAPTYTTHDKIMGDPFKYWPAQTDLTEHYKKDLEKLSLWRGTPEWSDKQQAAGRKDDTGKNELALIDPEFIEGLGAVLTHGGQLYGKYNWAKGISYHRVFSACLRHLYAWWKGQDNDPDTGLSHLYHAAANLQFLAHFHKNKEKYKEFDDRV